MVRWYWLKIQYKKLMESNQEINFRRLEDLKPAIVGKKNIVVMCSGPTANRMQPSQDDFYLVTNDSYKLVQNQDFLYYVHDGFFIRRFFANQPLCDNHDKSIFLYRSLNKPHLGNFKHFLKRKRHLSNQNFVISDFEDNVAHANDNYDDFHNFFEKHQIHTKIQNSGIFLLLLGFYIAYHNDLNLKIYGLDLGLGGKVHFEKGGFIGVSITHDRVKVNTKLQLDRMYQILGNRIKNHSNFNSNVE